MRISILDRILLFLTGLLAAYQVAVGINRTETIPMVAYTIAFGVLLVAGLLLIILGYDVLDNPIVVIISTIIPLSMSLGLVWEHLLNLRVIYLVFAFIGFLSILITRIFPMNKILPVLVIALIHGIAGITIFFLPIILSLTGRSNPGFALVGVGGGLIGIGGLLLSFLKTGHPILPRTTIFRLLPVILFLMTAAFVAGFAL